MASNNGVYCHRNCRRSMSEDHKIEKLEDDDYSDKLSRKSETYDDSQELEEMVTCPIHLGIMDDPRKLYCQHAYCYQCLKNYVNTWGALICPICRVKEKTSDVDKLPSALTEKQLIDVVMKHRLKKCVKDSQKLVSLSDDRKEELAKHLLKGINANNNVYKISDRNDDLTDKLSEDRIHMTSYLENSCADSTTSLTYTRVDIETIQENMLKHSQYKLVSGDAVKKIYKQINQIQNENVELSFSIFDMDISYNHSRLKQFVLMDCNNYKLFVYSESKFRTFHVCLREQIVKPEYIRIIRGNLVLSGRLETSEGVVCVFLQCNMNGEITHQSEHHSWSDPSSLPMMLGFDFNSKEDKYYLCMPTIGTVRIYDTSFVDLQEAYEFENNKPEYIAFSSAQNQLWVSCPENKKIIIVDIETRIIRLFDTEQINKAIPKMIFVTDDDKILFLDIKGNRIIWIKRRNEYILTQKLKIPSIYQDLDMKAFQVLPFSMIILGVENKILMFQSSKYNSRSRRILESCNVL